MKVILEQEVCIGCEACAEVCPQAFHFDPETEKAEVILAEGGPVDCIEDAMEACPVNCIHWEDYRGFAALPESSS